MIQQFHFWVFYPKESKAESQRDISSPMFLLFTIAKNENNVMFINRWMDKEILVYTYNGILLSLLKEGNSPMFDKVDEPWGHYASVMSTEELMLLNCGVGEYSWESLGLQRDPTSPS